MLVVSGEGCRAGNKPATKGSLVVPREELAIKLRAASLEYKLGHCVHAGDAVLDTYDNISSATFSTFQFNSSHREVALIYTKF